MDKRLIVKNIVLVGIFNVTSFDKFFFIKNNFFNEEDILESSIFNHDIVFLNTKDLEIQVVLNQIIIKEVLPQEKSTLLVEISKKFIESGKITSISAAGINFNWYFISNKNELISWSKDNFYNNESNLLSTFFNSKDSMFGSYASTNVLNARLKLDIKPASGTALSMEGEEKEELNLMIFNFNYHFDIKNYEDELSKILDEYDAYLKHAIGIIEIYK